jgi:predicted MFS family arabinose efflux permease
VLGALSIEYGLDAAGLVPHMVFLVDFVARGLRQGLTVGASYWIVFGLGAMVGPVLAGQLADRIGFARAVRVAFLAQAVAVAALVATTSPVALFVSSAVVGALVPGIVPLVLGRVHELIPDDPPRQAAAWSVTTVAFALGQAGAGYGFSFLYTHTGSYTALFAIAAATLATALAIDLVVAFASPRAARSHRHA